MAEKIKDIIAWLMTLPENELVGIDEGGLALEPVHTDAYFEIGGMPEEQIQGIEDVINDISDLLHNVDNNFLTQLRNSLGGADHVVYLGDSMWKVVNGDAMGDIELMTKAKVIQNNDILIKARTLRLTEDNTGCSEDLTVVGKVEFDELMESIQEHFEKKGEEEK